MLKKLNVSISGMFYIAGDDSVYRIQGSVFYKDIETLINTYSSAAHCWSERDTKLIGITLCEFETTQELKDKMCEYLV